MGQGEIPAEGAGEENPGPLRNQSGGAACLPHHRASGLLLPHPPGSPDHTDPGEQGHLLYHAQVADGGGRRHGGFRK